MLPYLILLLLVYGVAVLFYRNQQFLDCVTFLLWKIGTPFVVGVPVLLFLTGERKNIIKSTCAGAGMFFVWMSFFTGV